MRRIKKLNRSLVNARFQLDKNINNKILVAGHNLKDIRIPNRIKRLNKKLKARIE